MIPKCFDPIVIVHRLLGHSKRHIRRSYQLLINIISWNICWLQPPAYAPPWCAWKFLVSGDRVTPWRKKFLQDLPDCVDSADQQSPVLVVSRVSCDNFMDCEMEQWTCAEIEYESERCAPNPQSPRNRRNHRSEFRISLDRSCGRNQEISFLLVHSISEYFLGLFVEDSLSTTSVDVSTHREARSRTSCLLISVVCIIAWLFSSWLDLHTWFSSGPFRNIFIGKLVLWNSEIVAALCSC